MILQSLSLVNYKNFEAEAFAFDAKINCFVGANGVGKTNVLDAIYHLSFGKSYFNPITSQNINHAADFFVIEGQYQKEEYFYGFFRIHCDKSRERPYTAYLEFC